MCFYEGQAPGVWWSIFHCIFFAKAFLEWSCTTEFWQQHHVERWNVIHQMLSSGNSTQTKTWANRKSSSRFKRLNQDWSGESESGRVPDDSREWCLDGLAPETVDSELALDLAVGDAVGATAFCLDAVLCGRQFDWQHKGMKQKVFRRNGGYWLPLFSRLSAGGGLFWRGIYYIYTCFGDIQIHGKTPR